MKHLRLFLFLSLLPTFSIAQVRDLSPIQKPQDGSKRVALIMGINDYQHFQKLCNAENDANDMAEALRKEGFAVVVAINPTRDEMNNAITKFTEKLDSTTTALIFYAGHGASYQNVNYLMPSDAKAKFDDEITSDGILVDNMLTRIQGAKIRLLFLDACRNNPLPSRGNITQARMINGGGWAKMEATTGSFIAFGTMAGTTASENCNGGERNGLFTQALLENIKTPGLSINDLLDTVRREVNGKSKGQQTPESNSLLVGPFYFNPQVTPPPPPQPPPCLVPTIEEITVPRALPLAKPIAFGAQLMGTAEQYLWNFGDGSAPSTDPIAQHTYTTAGRYNVTLSVTNRCGSSSITRDIVIKTPCRGLQCKNMKILLFGGGGAGIAGTLYALLGNKGTTPPPNTTVAKPPTPPSGN